MLHVVEQEQIDINRAWWAEFGEHKKKHPKDRAWEKPPIDGRENTASQPLLESQHSKSRTEFPFATNE
jgi:hypothetical protein